jgi:NADH:ubiquinone oxidoreductase subunit E
MEKKIKLKICVGTYCFVMGGNELKEIKNQLPADLKDKVYVEASVCLGCDAKGIEQKPPYVEIDGYLMPEANAEKIINYLRGISK